LKIGELLPSVEDWKRLQDIESALLRRRTVGRLAGLIALVSAALQVVFTIADKGYFDKLRTIFWSLITLRFEDLASIGLDFKTLITWILLLFAAFVYFLLRRTSVLLKESKEPFRYTFWIEPFEEIKGTPGERFRLGSSDRFALFDHDLIERLNQRIKRFSILKEPPSSREGKEAEAPPSRYSSHIHISGHYAVREDGNEWVVHVMPQVRIGPAGSAATVAQPVKYLLRRSGGPSAQTKLPDSTLGASDYLDIVERAYSSIATEVYARIEKDVREKLGLFPTAHLRAVALYHEAEDFARSNTVDAYEHAIKLYRESLRYFDLAWTRIPMWLFLRFRWLLWRATVRYNHQWARVVAGYAKALIYRQQTSTLMGRESNPLYELPELVAEVLKPMEKLQKQIGKRRAGSGRERLLAYLNYPRDSWFRHFFLWSYTPLFEAQKDALAELYLVDALAHHFLDCRERALKRLKEAAATAPDWVAKNPLYLLAKGLVEPVVDKAILYFRQAVELAPEFQMARWFLAYTHERAFRQQDELTPQRAQVILEDYSKVLTLNYGNILALSALGYVSWLNELNGDGHGRQWLEQGMEVKAIAKETFIGELSYRLARIEAESGSLDDCRSLYGEAIEADPEIGAFWPSSSESRVRSADFAYISLTMLRRYEAYKNTVEDRIQKERERAQRPDPPHDPKPAPVPEDTLRVVHGFVLNDYANACLCYFHHHGDNACLERAIRAYQRATEVNPPDARPWFNLQNAYSWNNEFEKGHNCYRRARELAPTWTSAAILAAKDNVVQLSQALAIAQARLKQIDGELEQARSQARIRLKAVQEHEISAIGPPPRQQADQGLPPGKSDPKDLDPAKPKPGDAARYGMDPEKAQGKRRSQAARPGPAKRDLAPSPSEPLNQEAIEKVRELESERNQEEQRYQRDKEQFGKTREEAQKVITDNSRLAALFQGTIQEQVRCLVNIPRPKLDGRDVEAMISLAEVWARGEGEELAAAQMLGKYLLELAPEEYRVTAVLLDVVPRLLKEDGPVLPEDAPVVPSGGPLGLLFVPQLILKRWRRARCRKLRARADEERRKLLERAEEQDCKFVQKWMEMDRRHFLALYWYIDRGRRAGAAAQAKGAELRSPERIRESYFAKIIQKWMEIGRRAFLALYWYIDRGRRAGAAAQTKAAEFLSPEGIKENYFGDAPHVYEDLSGWVLFKRREYAEAAAAFSRAIEHKPTAHRYHFHLGQCRERLKEWEDARSAYGEALRLKPGNTEYENGLASALNQIGNLHWNEDRFPDAVDNYREAVRFAPDVAVYHRNLALAHELAKLPDSMSALESACQEAKTAVDLAHQSMEYQAELRRLKTRLASFRCYGASKIMSFPTLVTALAIEYGRDLESFVRTATTGETGSDLEGRYAALQDRMRVSYGVNVPRARWRRNETDMPPGSYLVMVHEVPLVMGTVEASRKLYLGSSDKLRKMGLGGHSARDPLEGGEAVWLEQKDWAKADASALSALDPLDYVLRHLEDILLSRLDDFLGHQDVVARLKMSSSHEVSAIADSSHQMSALTEMLKALLAERAPILSFDHLCSLFLKRSGDTRPGNVIEEMRMLDEVRKHLWGNTAAFTLLPVGARLTELLSRGLVDTGSWQVLALEPETCQDALAAVRRVIADVQSPAVVVENPDLRMHLRTLIELEFPKVPVLAQAEVLKELAIYAGRVIELD
jgi:tetratricopeptide (TPR) repeat protein